MRDRYDGLRGKQSATNKATQSRLEAEHSSKDSFVKKIQNEQAKHAGKAPSLTSEAQKFNAYMTNNGMHAQELARDLTKGLDKTAFPVK